MSPVCAEKIIKIAKFFHEKIGQREASTKVAREAEMLECIVA